MGGDREAIEGMKRSRQSSSRSVIARSVLSQALLGVMLCLPCPAFSTDTPGVESLVGQLDGADYRQRAEIATKLGETGDPGALKPLLRLLDDELGPVRDAAATALGALGEERAVESLIEILDDPSENVRVAAAEALARFDDPRMIEPLKEVFREGMPEAEAAARALRNFGSRETAEFFGQFLGVPRLGPVAARSLLFIGGEAGDVVERAAVMGSPATAAAAIPLLADLRGKAALEPLLAALRSSHAKVRAAAAEALRELDDERIVERLGDAFSGESDRGKMRIIDVLGGIGNERAVGALILALDDDSAAVRARAASTLGEIGGDRAREALYGCFDDRDRSVRYAAIFALERVTGERVQLREFFNARKMFFAHPPYEAGLCSACHDPHTAKDGGELKLPARELCFGCHKAIGSRVTASRFFHGPVGEDRCEACHNAHGSNYPHLLRTYLPDEHYLPFFDVENFALCWQCHNREIVLEERTATLTSFRDGERNLHFIHVNRTKGRACKACHEPHAADQEKLAPPCVECFSTGLLPIQLTLTESGGSCVVGCHREMGYDRLEPAQGR